MTISELIAILQKAQDDHGDVKIVADDGRRYYEFRSVDESVDHDSSADVVVKIF